MSEHENLNLPETRTAAFFEQDPATIVNQLVEGDGMEIAIFGTWLRVKVVDAIPYSKKENTGFRYGKMSEMRPGDLYIPQYRQLNLSLIVAKDEDGVGACVRLKEVQYYDPTTKSFVPELRIGLNIYKKREGDIARLFSLETNRNESLKFLDETNTLYITRDEAVINQIPSGDANNQLRVLLDESGRSDLRNSISQNYPGGAFQLRHDLKGGSK